VFVEFDLETGEAFRLSASDKLEVPLSPWQSRLVAAMGPKAASAYAEKPQNAPAEKIVLPLGDKLPVRVAGENALRMEALELSIDGGAFLPAKPHMFVEQYRQVGQLQAHHLDFSSGFGLPLRPHRQYPIPAVDRLNFYVEALPERISLVHDRMGIMGEHQVRVNGGEVTFTPRRYYDQNNLAADIASLVKPGENIIEIAVTVTEDWHGVSDPLYLFGDFRRICEGRQIRPSTKRPPKRRLNTALPRASPFTAGIHLYRADGAAENRRAAHPARGAYPRDSVCERGRAGPGNPGPLRRTAGSLPQTAPAPPSPRFR
jgi:hypothetical protein